MRSLKDVKEKLMQDAEFRKEYNDLENAYRLAEMVIRTRIEAGLTQKELADRLGTKQANISRLESGSYNPSVRLLQKIAKATGKQLEINFR